jgi:positive regulator of sigma E activity
MIAGYDLIMNKEDGQEINLGFIEERLLDTALWFYMLEKTIDIVVVRDGKILQTIP